jgi:branched-chain amino acid transport system substrate-binding protein
MERRVKGIILFFSLLMLVALISGVAIAENEEPIVIGSIWSLVGAAAPLGQAHLRGSNLAVKLVNEAGGIFGHPIEYHNIDGQTDLTAISNATKRLTEELKVVAGLGSEDDSLTSAMGPIFQSHKTPLVIGSATTPTQTRIGDYIFMSAYGDNEQGRAAAKYCVEKLGWKKVAIMWDNASAYSTLLSKVFMESFKEFTGDPDAVVIQEIYQTGDVNYSAQLTRLKLTNKPIDGLVVTPPFPQDGPIIAKQARALGIVLPSLFTDGADDVSIIEVGGEAVEGAIVSTQFAGDHPLTENAGKFIKAYIEEYGAPPGCFEDLGFDAMRLVIESIETIGKEKWESMGLDEQRTAIRDTLQAHTFTTTTAPISYPDPKTAEYPRVPLKTVVFKVVRNGELIFLDLLTPEEIFK